MFHPCGAELFRKFVNGYAGQGESERMNKSVKATRSIKRNRQSHQVTAAYVELKKWFRKSACLKRKATEVQQPYLRCVRDKIEIARQLRDEERLENEFIAAAVAVAAAEAFVSPIVEHDHEDEVETEIDDEEELDPYNDSSDDDVTDAFLVD